MFPTIQLGPLAVQAPGLILLIGLWLGLTISEKTAARFQANAAEIYNLVFFGMLAGLVGARISYAVQYFSTFQDNPLSLLSFNPGLFDPLGGALIGLLIAIIYGSRKQLPFWETLDGLTPLLAVMGIAFGLAHLASGDAFGAVSNLPWSIELWGARRHPTQIYEIILAIWIFWLILRSSKKTDPARSGQLFLRFVALTATAQLFVETFRGDSLLLENGIRSAQLLAWATLAASLYLFGRRLPNIRNPESNSSLSEGETNV